MPQINPAYHRYRLRLHQGPIGSNPAGILKTMLKEARGQDNFTVAWRQLNHSDFADQTARAAILSLINPLLDPRTTNRTITSIRFINSMTDLAVENDLDKYLAQPKQVVQEMAIHRAACEGPSGYIHEPMQRRFGLVPEDRPLLANLYYAVSQNRYQPNLPWLASTHHFSRDLLLEIARKLAAQYTAASGNQQNFVESALVATAIAESQTTFEAVLRIIAKKTPELADAITEDRRIVSGEHFAYHFTDQELIPSIAENGLSIKFAPEGREEQDVLCFNNTANAAIEYALLSAGKAYYGGGDYLLRIPLDLEGVSFEGGLRGADEQQGNMYADYLLGKDKTIPAEHIELVDPLIATRAAPLII